MGFHLREPVDFERHNKEVKKVWAAYHEGKPYRVPVTVTGSITNFFCNPELNDTGRTFEDFFKDPQVQIDAQLAFQKYKRHNWLADQEMGPPDAWGLSVDFQNSYSAGWFGCPLKYDGPVPDTVELLGGDDKMKLYELEPPDPVRGNLLGRAVEFLEYMEEKCPSMEFEGRPVTPPTTIPGEGTDGPFTIACKLRGLTNCCTDMLDDEKYFRDLMTFVTDNIVRRMKGIREWRWERQRGSADKGPFNTGAFGYADDAVAMLSVEQFREFVLPYHRQLIENFSDGESRNSIHLCGDATHLFPFMRDKLNIYSFDTGFPVDFGALRRALGPEVTINGGVTVMLLKDGSPDEIRADVKRICESGIMEGGKFILREANNLAPCTPVENIAAMYEAAKEFGRYT